MTKREFYKAVAENRIDNEVIEFAKDAIIKLDNSNERRKERGTTRQRANEPIKAEILELFTPELQITGSEVADALEIKSQKAAQLLKILVDEGKLEHFKSKPHEPYCYKLSASFVENMTVENEDNED